MALRRHAFKICAGIVAVLAIGGMMYLRMWPPMAIVQSGSMVPKIAIGDVVVLKHMDGPPHVGDIIAITVPDAMRARFGYPPEITHRVVAIARNGDITTKGDALKSPDPFKTPQRAVKAKVVATLPAIGRVFAFLTSTLGLIWLAGGALLLFVLPQLDQRRAREEHEHTSLVALHTKLEELSTQMNQQRRDADADAAAREDFEDRITALVEEIARRPVAVPLPMPPANLTPLTTVTPPADPAAPPPTEPTPPAIAVQREKEFDDRGGDHVHVAFPVAPGALERIAARLRHVDHRVDGPLRHPGPEPTPAAIAVEREPVPTPAPIAVEREPVPTPTPAPAPIAVEREPVPAPPVIAVEREPVPAAERLHTPMAHAGSPAVRRQPPPFTGQSVRNGGLLGSITGGTRRSRRRGGRGRGH